MMVTFPSASDGTPPEEICAVRITECRHKQGDLFVERNILRMGRNRTAFPVSRAT